MATLDGKNKHHGLGSIAVANGCFDNDSVHRQRIPGSKLPKIRKKRYDKMVMSSYSNTDPALLSPSLRAAFFHGLRVYHQLKVWQSLSDTDVEPLEWGWEMKDGLFMPIMTDEPPGPQDLLRAICCSCKEYCGK